LYAGVDNIYSKKEISIHQIGKKEKEIHASFAVSPQATKVTSTVLDKCLVKMEKTYNLRVEDIYKNVLF
jgi:hypothetical protein